MAIHTVSRSRTTVGAFIGTYVGAGLLVGGLALAGAILEYLLHGDFRDRYAELFRLIERVSGASADELRAFLATGMLMNVAAALDLQAVADREPWAGRLLGEEFAAKLRDA